LSLHDALPILYEDGYNIPRGTECDAYTDVFPRCGQFIPAFRDIVNKLSPFLDYADIGGGCRLSYPSTSPFIHSRPFNGRIDLGMAYWVELVRKTEISSIGEQQLSTLHK